MSSFIEKYDKVLKLIKSEKNNHYIKNTLISLLTTNQEFINFVIEEQKYLLSLIDIELNNINIRDSNKLFQLLEVYSLSCLVYLSEITPNKKSIPEIIKNNRELFIKKNKDYGNSFEDFGYIGIIIRINDKINRLKSLYRRKTINIEDESFEDTINDLYNYTILGLLYK